MKSLLVVWVVASGACAATGPQPPAAPPRTTTLGLGISTLKLRNGLRVVLVRDPQAAEIQVTMRYGVGAADDPPDRPGMAHLVEHLMFLQVLGGQSLAAHLETSATFHNAFTSWDATTYITRARPGFLDKLLSIEAVRAGFRCTSITDAEFARERQVVVQEVKLRSRISELIHAIHRGVFADGHPYRRSVAGTVEVVGAITRQQACAFADAHYAPQNAALVISGPLTQAEIVASLEKFIAKIPSRNVTPRVPMPPQAAPRHVEVPVPIDSDAILVAWPLPHEPDVRARIGAIISSLVASVDSKIKGTVAPVMLGDSRAPMLTLVIVPGANESVTEALAGVRKGADAFPLMFQPTAFRMLDEFTFDTIQQSAIYQMYASLEDGGGRDTLLAEYALANRDPKDALAASLIGLRDLRRENAAELARTRLNFDRANVVVLKATEAKKTGTQLSVVEPIHDIGLRRGVVDASAAHRFAADQVATRHVTGMRTRVLPNGLKVVLLPLTSVPTIDIRLIFAAGTADEPAAKPGAALVAAYALTFARKYVNDAIRFAAAGGTDRVEVGDDFTAFGALGVDMHVDLLLAGLRRWVREGVYDFNSAALARAIRYQRKRVNDDDALADAERVALFGLHHPYVRGGVMRYVSERLTPSDAEEFRAAHFTPDNATLVIAGRFDAALADRWIDFLFADWRGQATRRDAPRVAPSPASFVKVEDLAQVRLQIALPASANGRAHRLIAAAMLDEIVSDVRFQLGASYALAAALSERRLASTYVIDGSVDATRLSEAVRLIKDRIAALKTNGDAAARAFVLARQRVFTQLASSARSATQLAGGVQQEVAMLRPPMSDLATAAEVQALTIGGMADTLAELDLGTAVVTMRGPKAETESAFAVLGRTAKPVQVDQASLDALEELPAAERHPKRIDDDEIAPPITAPAEPPDFTFALAAGYSFATLGNSFDSEVMPSPTSGFAISGEVAHRVTHSTQVGLHLGMAIHGGTYTLSSDGVDRSLQNLAFDVEGFFQIVGFDRVRAAALLGLHADQITLGEIDSMYVGLDLGLQLSADVFRRGQHRFGVLLRGETVISDTSYTALTFGITYRR